MANTVIAIRASGTAAATPSLGVIANGEIALNYADGIIYYKTSSNTLGSIRTTQPAGLTTEIQFNDAGSFGSNAALTFNKTTGLLSSTLLKSTQSAGDEGGQLDLATSVTNTTLAGGSVAIDVYQNRLRIFETGGTNRGVYIDLANGAGAGVSTNLISGSVTSVAGATGAVSNNQILAGLLTVDGLGSGLDADLLDGLNSASFANAAFANTDYTTISATATTYGNAAYIPVTTLAANGRVSAIVNTAIAISTTQITSGVLPFAQGGANATSYTTGTFLTSNGTALVSVANTGTAGTYGNAAYHPVITTDAYGRVSAVTNTLIQIATTQITSGVLPFAQGGTNAASYTTGTLLTSNGTTIISLANTGTAGTYANSNTIPVITTDAYGRVSSIVNTAIQTATTSLAGIVQLNDTITSTSTTQAATANSVKTAYTTASADAVALAIALG